MEALSEDQFRLKHFKQRLAQIVVQHEDALADSAVKLQLVTQERDDLRDNVNTLSGTVAELKAEVERLTADRENVDFVGTPPPDEVGVEDPSND